MKKLIIAASVVVAAVVCQAATIKWNSTNAKLVDPKTGSTQSSLSSGSIMLVVLSDTKGWADGTWSAKAGSVTELASATIGSNKTAGKITGVTYTWQYESDKTGSSVKDGNMLAVVFKDSSGAYDQLEYFTTKAAVTDTMTVSGLDSLGDTWTQTFNFAQGDAASGGIYAPVPEPTSAMLVLLGFTGLALKRKRA